MADKVEYMETTRRDKANKAMADFRKLERDFAEFQRYICTEIKECK